MLRLGRWGGLVLVYCDQASPGTSRGQCGVKWGPGAGHWAPGTLAQAGTLAPVRGGGSGLHTTTPPPPPRHTAACI